MIIKITLIIATIILMMMVILITMIIEDIMVMIVIRIMKMMIMKDNVTINSATKTNGDDDYII